MLKKHKIFFTLIVVLSLESHVTAAKKGNTKEKKETEEKPEDEMEGRIVGGKPITLKTVPYSVQLFNQGSMCAGTILNSWALLTAAHCVDINKNVLEMVVQVGSRYVYDFNAVQYNVVDVLIHKKYNRSLFTSDIALVFLERPIEFSNKIKKAVLVNNDKWMNPTERNFTVTGWGWTQNGGPISKKGLMMTSLRFVTSEECNKLHNITLAPDMFCLYGDGVRDTCKGDSGGGVFWHGLMVGITSHGDGCAKKLKPSVYTNVHYFRDWIEKEMLRYIRENCQFSYDVNNTSNT